MREKYKMNILLHIYISNNNREMNKFMAKRKSKELSIFLINNTKTKYIYRKKKKSTLSTMMMEEIRNYT